MLPLRTYAAARPHLIIRVPDPILWSFRFGSSRPAFAFPYSYPDEAVARLREHGHRTHRDSPRLGPQSWSYSCPSTSTGRCTYRDSGDLTAILGITPNPSRILRGHGYCVLYYEHLAVIVGASSSSRIALHSPVHTGHGYRRHVCVPCDSRLA
ncbi:hypothetical protein C8R44DRAFT_892536 [Mycena epipterygia]|nr:hypothetical protein C8R44DRAFT_892536 [Mycena epipterygia]